MTKRSSTRSRSGHASGWVVREAFPTVYCVTSRPCARHRAERAPLATLTGALRAVSVDAKGAGRSAVVAVTAGGIAMSAMTPAVADPAPADASPLAAKQAQVALHADQARQALAAAPAVQVVAEAVIEVERTADQSAAAVEVTPAPLPPPPPPAPRAAPVASRTADRAAVGNPAPGGTWEAAASIALRYIGVPYVFGGQTPAGFDCSGLVVHVFRQLGVELPHQSTRIRDSARTVRIARADARPGDIIWTPGHVSIYLGNGQLVEAVSPGRPLRTHRVWQTNPMFLRVV